MQRVGREGAWSVAFWNVRRVDGGAAGYEALLLKPSSGYRGVTQGRTPLERIAQRLGRPLDLERVLAWEDPLDWETLLGRTRSASYVIHEVPDRAGYEAELWAWFDSEQRAGRVRLPYECVLAAGGCRSKGLSGKHLGCSRAKAESIGQLLRIPRHLPGERFAVANRSRCSQATHSPLRGLGSGGTRRAPQGAEGGGDAKAVEDARSASTACFPSSRRYRCALLSRARGLPPTRAGTGVSPSQAAHGGRLRPFRPRDSRIGVQRRVREGVAGGVPPVVG